MINYNGEIISKDDLYLDIDNRAFKFGDSVFETMKVIGTKIIFGNDHYFRLMYSMRISRMEIPSFFSPDYLRGEILKIISKRKLSGAVRVRLTVYRKEGGLYTPKNDDVNFIIEAMPLESVKYLIPQGDYQVDVFKDHYKSKGLLSNIKTNNSLIHVVAGVFQRENDLDNSILVNSDRHLAEANNGNIFLVKNNQVRTPSLEEGCVKGIMRMNLIKLLLDEGYKVTEESISPFELQRCDEVFITNVIIGIQPITKYRKKTFKVDLAHHLINRINSIVSDRVVI
nr:aminotransferase class IV [Ichthyobacterium seriolicida]